MLPGRMQFAALAYAVINRTDFSSGLLLKFAVDHETQNATVVAQPSGLVARSTEIPSRTRYRLLLSGYEATSVTSGSQEPCTVDMHGMLIKNDDRCAI